MDEGISETVEGAIAHNYLQNKKQKKARSREVQGDIRLTDLKNPDQQPLEGRYRRLINGRYRLCMGRPSWLAGRFDARLLPTDWIARQKI